jgi:general secretion pathway protein A
MLPAYLKYWGLRDPPFSLAPNPSMFYLSDQHRECLMRLRFAIHSGKGGALLISENAGDGKTTTLHLLMREMTEEHGDKLRIAFLDYPTMTPTQMIGEIGRQIGVQEIRGDKVEDINALRDLLKSNHIQGIHTLVIVDEGQMLADRPDLLQEFRILLNFTTEGEFLLSFILSGQAPLEPAVRAMPEFWQRLPVRFFLKNLHLKDTGGMIAHRIRLAGGDRALFTETAVEGIYRYSGGCPRVICAVADLALVVGHSNRARQVDFNEVTQACSDMEHSGASYHYFNFLEGDAAGPPPGPPPPPEAPPMPPPESGWRRPVAPPAPAPAQPPPVQWPAHVPAAAPYPAPSGPAAPWPEPAAAYAPAPAPQPVYDSPPAYAPPRAHEPPPPLVPEPWAPPPAVPGTLMEPVPDAAEAPRREDAVTCRACGQEIDEDIEACTHCGAALKVACERCRSPQSALLKACAYCGYPLHTWAREAEREFLAGLKRLNLYLAPRETDAIKYRNHRTLDGRVLYFAPPGGVLREGALVRELKGQQNGRLKGCGVIIGSRRLVLLHKERAVDIPLTRVQRCDPVPDHEGGVVIRCPDTVWEVRFPVREGRRAAFCRLVQAYLNRMAGA